MRGVGAGLRCLADVPVVEPSDVYSRVDLGDLRDGLKRIAIPEMPTLAIAASALPLVPAGPRGRPGRNEGPEASVQDGGTPARSLSGRLDLNQRPLAPQLNTAGSAGIVPDGTGEQALEIIESAEPTETSNGIDTTPDQRRLVPPVSPHAAVPLEQLLTVREAAEHLRICRATVYKLCAAGALSHVCISNAIRLTRADLANFIAQQRRLR